MILIIDNYDSFVHNLARYVRELGHACHVVRNDAMTLGGVAELAPSHIIVSPGPCTPDQAGLSVAIVKRFGRRIPILGICLGHQCIAQAYGGRIVRAAEPVHGKTSLVRHDGRGVFRGLPSPFRATRYHSLVVAPDSMPRSLVVTSWTPDGAIMGLAHKSHPVVGLQFHPEAVLTDHGHALIANFLSIPQDTRQAA